MNEITSVKNSSTTYQFVGLIGWLLLCFSAASTGVFVSTGDWYASITKPTWNPPSWIFGPVWTLLYIMMAVSAWLVWRDGGWKTQWRLLGVFVVQLALNAMWTPLFFGLHLPGVAFFEIVVLWLVLATTVILFGKFKMLSGLLIVPYWVWVSFAAFLNFTIWRLNS